MQWFHEETRAWSTNLHLCLVSSFVSNSLRPLDCSPPVISVHGIVPARILDWAASSSSRESSWLRNRTLVCHICCTAGRFLTPEPQGKPHIRQSEYKLEENFFAMSSQDERKWNYAKVGLNGVSTKPNSHFLWAHRERSASMSDDLIHLWWSVKLWNKQCCLKDQVYVHIKCNMLTYYT